jgi:hypothetical protein
MKFTTLFTAAALAISPALSCLQTFGVIAPPNTLAFALSVDNGEVTCNSDWGHYIDQDGHFSLSCLDGYVYAFTMNGEIAWYSNGVDSFQLQQPVQQDSTGSVFYWSQENFGC